MSSLARLSHLSQIRLLRQLAEGALHRYRIGKHKLHFINHGENTTFRVHSARQGRFLFRIHRHGYHTKEALMEELAFLRHLGDHGLSVPVPVPTRTGRSLVHAFHDGIPEGRYCDLLHWVDGRFIDESVSEKHMFALGEYMGKLRKLAHSRKVIHRRYWDAEGLVGPRGKFGSLDRMPGISGSVQRKLTDGRRLVFRELLAFEKKFPARQGLIHADMHFGNFLVKKGGAISAIDFDDCGFGFHAYELVPALTHLEHMATGRRFERLKAFLIEGYASAASWDEHDQKILPYLFFARKLMMIGWMNSRSDIARFRRMVPKSAARVAERLRELRQ
jgi:Ser/Thr protein kinase RdoA (MazF antagonist)